MERIPNRATNEPGRDPAIWQFQATDDLQYAPANRISFQYRGYAGCLA